MSRNNPDRTAGATNRLWTSGFTNTRLLVVSVIALVLAMGVWTTTIHAETFTVDRLDDDPGAYSCTPQGAIDCSLRGAIIASNLTPGPDVVELPAETLTLTFDGDDDEAGFGDLDILDDVVIVGMGQKETVIDAGGLDGLGDRVFEICLDDLEVTMTDLTVKGGVNLFGGGILNRGTLTLLRVALTENDATGFGGGGLYCMSGTAGLTDCEVTKNKAGFGGGIAGIGGTLAITRTLISDNDAASRGGGIATEVPTSVLESEISLNDAAEGGGIYSNVSENTIDRSTLSYNSAETGAALFNAAGTTIVTNSTVSLNWATGTSPGGVIYAKSHVKLLACTINSNVTSAPVLLVNDVGTFILINTLIKGTCGSTSAFSFVSLGGNLESPGHTCGLRNGTGDFEDVTAAQLAIGPLRGNGGPTETHALGTSSVAIDAGLNTSCRTTDQRGVPRPIDGDGNGSVVCDIGAVEIGPLFWDGFESGDVSAWSIP